MRIPNKTEKETQSLKLTLTVGLSLALILSGCSKGQPASSTNSTGQPNQGSADSPPLWTPPVKLDTLREGEAGGSIKVEGLTYPVKYAYAGHGEMFGEDAIVLLLTDKPVAPDVLAKSFGDSYGMFPEGTNGLEYKIGKGFWVRFHPGAFQTSGINTLHDYSVENGVVKGSDEDSTSFDKKEYGRSVSFIARVVEKK
jgi:hypothetical protein